MKLPKIFTDGDMFKDISDPTVLRLGDEDDFETGPFDHSLDGVDAGPVLRATRKALTRTLEEHAGEDQAPDGSIQGTYLGELALAEPSRAQAASRKVGKLTMRYQTWRRRRDS